MLKASNSKRKMLLIIIVSAMMVIISASVVAGLFYSDKMNEVIVDGYNFGPVRFKEELNICDYGADNTGVTDNTKLMQAIHKTGKRIYYPNGSYRFNGISLDLSGGVRFESMDGVVIRNDISDMNIIQFDDFGNLIGLMQNHLELDSNDIIKKCGSLVPPPLSTKTYETKADLLAYWYNDFGLESIRESKTGWIGWYYWSWNHHDAATNPYLKADIGEQPDPYDPTRHPLLGFYYGDDPVVLDWQCYWLNEYGARNVIILADDIANWEKTGSPSHWAYQLFNNTPNFKNIRYALTFPTPWVQRGDTQTRDKVRDQWKRMAEVYSKYENYYFIEKNGKKYPLISLLEERALEGVFDNYSGSGNTRQFFIEMTEYFQSLGFDGVALLSRNPIEAFETEAERAFFESIGMIRFRGSYVPDSIPQNAFFGKYTYAEVVDLYAPPSDRYYIQSIATAFDSQTPHQSKWKCPGYNPSDFGRWIRKAVEHLDSNPDMPRIITCYNISEWAEGGPGLQPNVHDRFGYLEAVRDNLIIK